MVLVSYSRGSYEDYREIHLFVTDDKEKAEKYIQKANAILEKWSLFYEEKSTDEANGDYEQYTFTPRYVQLDEINGFFTKEIESR